MQKPYSGNTGAVATDFPSPEQAGGVMKTNDNTHNANALTDTAASTATPGLPDGKLKITVIGGSGLIGSKVVALLRAKGHEVHAASPSSGVNAVTGEGLAKALAGANVVVDVSNSPSFEDRAVMEFFEKSNTHLLAAEKAAGVAHHVALSVVGTERLQASGYFRAKLAQETMIQASPIPWTIVRATQFFEFVGAIAQASTSGEVVKTAPALMQPIHSSDVAEAVADAALAAPLNAISEVAGPEAIRIDEVLRQYFQAHGDARQVVADPSAGYFGTPVDDHSLTPGKNPRLGKIHFADWLARTAPAR
jgi:uncharacterized protein YbjT (DUF2867 family)